MKKNNFPKWWLKKKEKKEKKAADYNSTSLSTTALLGLSVF